MGWNAGREYATREVSSESACLQRREVELSSVVAPTAQLDSDEVVSIRVNKLGTAVSERHHCGDGFRDCLDGG